MATSWICPRKIFGIDVDDGFEPTYEISPNKTQVVARICRRPRASPMPSISRAIRTGKVKPYARTWPKYSVPRWLKKMARTAPGPMETERKRRRGREEPNAKPSTNPAANHIFRVMFNETTKKAIRAAFEHPGQINSNLVDAQQARRVLDRLVGYKISPLLSGQGTARTLCRPRANGGATADRRARSRNPCLHSVEYWSIHAQLAAGEPPVFEAKLSKYKGEDIEVHTQAEAGRTRLWPLSSRHAGRLRAWRKRKSGASHRLPLRHRNCSRPATTACATRPNAPWAMAQRLYEGVRAG